MPDFGRYTTVAVEAAMEGAKILKKYFHEGFDVRYKREKDPVTIADEESEKAIKDVIAKNFPDHEILAEEAYAKNPKDYHDYKGYLWMVDPLDGTVNFKHRVPIFAISIALTYSGEPIVGVIYAPLLNELFIAEKGKGTYFNDQLVKVSNISDLQYSLLVTGFPYDFKQNPDIHIKYFKELHLRSEAIRRLGAAALDLAYVACGRFEAFWEAKNSPWDTAAGALMVFEAGGKVTDYSGNPYSPFNLTLIASNGLVHDQLVEVLKGGI